MKTEYWLSCPVYNIEDLPKNPNILYPGYDLYKCYDNNHYKDLSYCWTFENNEWTFGKELKTYE